MKLHGSYTVYSSFQAQSIFMSLQVLCSHMSINAFYLNLSFYQFMVYFVSPTYTKTAILLVLFAISLTQTNAYFILYVQYIFVV
jgi:hypothetical protein